MWNPERDTAFFNQFGKNRFPGHMGIEITEVSEGKLVAEMEIQPFMFAPNEFLHAGSLVTLGDTVAGYATVAHLPEGAHSFTTLELKSNFMRAARTGILVCEGKAEHMGRTTQVWTATIRSRESGKKIALFTCTQLILYP